MASGRRTKKQLKNRPKYKRDRFSTTTTHKAKKKAAHKKAAPSASANVAE